MVTKDTSMPAAVNSSSDVASLAQQYVQADRASRDQYFSSQQNRYNAQLSAYNDISEQLGTFQDAAESLIDERNANQYSVTAPEDSVATVTTSGDADTGSYELFVEQLASPDKYALTFDEDTTLPTSGSLELSLGDESFSVDMAQFSDGANLASLRDAINNDQDNPGIRASIIRSGGESMLVIASEEAGADNTVAMSTDGSAAMSDFAAAITNRTQLSQAQDAVVYLGQNKALKVTSDSNHLDEVIGGLDITLNKVSKDDTDTMTFSVESDADATADKLQEFVDSYNDLISTMRQYTNNNSTISEDDDSSSSSPALSGDSTVRLLKNQIRNVFSSANLYSLGLEVDSSGQLALDKDRLTDTLATSPDALNTVLFGTDSRGKTGALGQLDDLLDTYIQGPSAVMNSRQDSVQQNLDRLQDQMDAFDQQMDNQYQRYLSQFTAMQQLVSQMQSSANLFSA